MTDANLVLGRLRPDAFLGGRMTLDPAAARAAIARLGQAMGLTPEQAAQGVVDLANEHMARALRVISVQRGTDPRGFVLVSFGGAGGLHVCALAEALGMTRALVPVHAGVLSALGMLAARPGRTLTRTWGRDLAGLADGEVQARLGDLAEEGVLALEAEGLAPGDLTMDSSLDLRYRGQSYTLEVPWAGVASSAEGFHQAHLARYGHRLDLPVELVNLRVRVLGPEPELRLPPAAVRAEGPRSPALVVGWPEPVPVLPRGAISGSQVAGPAIVVDAVATTWLAPGWMAQADAYGNLQLRRGG